MNDEVLDDRLSMLFGMILLTRAVWTIQSTKARKPDSTVDAWAILFLIILVVGTAVFWVSHQ